MSFIPNYVRCSVKGEAAVRFINLCRNHGIALKELVADENGFQMDIRAEDFKKLGPLIRKTHVKIHILNRRGPAFFFYRHRLRYWFLAGILVCGGLVWYMSLFVWQIDIVGNRKYTDDLILQSLRAMDVSAGCRKSELSLPSIEEELRIIYNQITWVSASVTGTRLLIEIKEGNLQTADTESGVNGENGTAGEGNGENGTAGEEGENGAKGAGGGNDGRNGEDLTPSNLAAVSDATVTSMVVRRGTAAVKTGDQVARGDTLVEGKVYIYNDDQTLKKIDYTRADADIFGDYEVYYEADYPREYEVRVYDEDFHRQVSLGWGGHIMALPDFYTEPETCEIWAWEKHFRLTPTFYLPFALYFTEYRPYELAVADYTDGELKAMAQQGLTNYLEELEKKGVQIIGNSVTILLDANGGHASGTLSLNGPIGESVPIDYNSMAENRRQQYLYE